MATIRIRDNGPYVLSGDFELTDPDGNRYPTSGSFELCRCGHSSNKPFCDGTHARIGFESAFPSPDSVGGDPRPAR
jgi:CDGSH-type Zn-finger protein